MLLTQVLEHADSMRREILPRISQARKSEFGQFMTPSFVAKFMASLFPKRNLEACRLLDPGAGIGALSCAFLDRLTSGDFGFQHVDITAYEVDDVLRPHLEKTLSRYAAFLSIQPRVLADDFIESAVRDCMDGKRLYTHAILNPPYKKINSDSKHRTALRRVGIETVNLYSAFMALTLALLESGGQLVAIIPRSFCNGPYYHSFRKYFLQRSAIRHIHLFHSRNKAFKDDDVLQENLIIMLERDGKQEDVTISTSHDDRFFNCTSYVLPFQRIVLRDDRENFIHVPISLKRNIIELSLAIRFTLDDIGIKVSTGPVVDFRVREHIRDMPEAGCVPLLYPNHFNGQAVKWPKGNMKKPNAIFRNTDTEKLLYPRGFYTVVRRFSSKEQKRRIMASVVDPDALQESTSIGFENHLNVFHQNKKGLPETLARGLSVFLNMTAVDDHFRCFNGHTQVNATDLRLMKYPSRDKLSTLGQWAQTQAEITQKMIDEQFQVLNY